MPIRETKKVLIVVRTYPTPAKKGVEVSCTAAITEKGEWIRLFPIPYRFLDYDQRFKKYQWIEVEVTKASDPRPESYKLNSDSIRIISEVLDSANAWRSRKNAVKIYSCKYLNTLIQMSISTMLCSHCLICLGIINTCRLTSGAYMKAVTHYASAIEL